jgi:hypothetical protein
LPGIRFAFFRRSHVDYVNKAGWRNKRSRVCGNKHQRTETRTRPPGLLRIYVGQLKKESATPEEIYSSIEQWADARELTITEESKQ